MQDTTDYESLGYEAASVRSALEDAEEASEVAEAVRDLLDALGSDEWRSTSYEEGGYLTTDAGFVLRLGSREFQFTVVRSA